MKEKQKGFTLMEMLIVVAIVGILVAIAIPSFTSALNKTRETVCLANRTSLYHEILTDSMLNNGLDEALIHSYDQAAIKSKGYVCPSRGEIKVKLEPVAGTVIVGCGIHGQVQPSYDFGGTVEIYMEGKLEKTILELFQKFNRSDLPQIDSTAPEGGNYSGKIIAALKELTNHSLGLGVTKTWSLCNVRKEGNTIAKTYQVYWSGVDITACKAGDEIVTMYYDASTQQYALKRMTVKVNRDSSVGGGKPYNIIDTAKGTQIMSGSFLEVYRAYEDEVDP